MKEEFCITKGENKKKKMNRKTDLCRLFPTARADVARPEV
jgi:hypothetical protein